MFNEDEEVKDIRYLFNGTAFNKDEDNDVDEDKITYKESPLKSIIVDIRIKLSRNGDKLIKKDLYYVEEIKSLGTPEIKNIKGKLIKFKNELIRKNKINNRIKKDLDDYNGNTEYKGIKDIRYLFNEEGIYNGINDIKYLFDGIAFNENEDKITHKDVKRDFCYAEKIKKNKIKTTHKESSFKSIIQDIKRGLYYVEKMNNLSISNNKNIKEKLVKFKNELFNNNNKIKKDPSECKDIKYIRYLFNEDKSKKMKNLAAKNIKVLNEYKGIKDIRYLFNYNIYKGIKDIRYLFNRIAFNEDYYIENINSEFKKLSNCLVKGHTKDIRYMVDYINNGEKLEERPINLEDVRDKFIAYSDNLPFGILSKSSYIDLKNIGIFSSVIFDDEYKISKTE